MARPDNVTPFRPRRPPPKAPRGSGGLGLATHRGRVVLVHLLTLLGFAVGFFGPGLAMNAGASIDTANFVSFLGLAFGLAALFIAAGNRQSAMPWAATHHEHAVRTLVIGLAIWTLAGLLQYFGPLAIATIFIQIGVLIWVGVRASVGLVLAILRRPIWRPSGILF